MLGRVAQSVALLTQSRFGHIFSFLLIQEGQLSVTGERYVHEVLVNRLGGLSLSRKSVVRLNDRPGMTIGVYRGRKTTTTHNLRLKIMLLSPAWTGKS